MGKFKDIWNRDLDGSNKERRSFVRYAIVVLCIFVAFFLLKKDNLIRWVQAGITIRRQEKQIELLQEQNRELDKTIRMMSNDRDTLEKYARENFGFAEPGDDVYLTE